MARQYMTKEVTTTTIKAGKIIMQEGTPTVQELSPIVVMGTISNTKATRTVNKKYGFGVTIYSMEEETKIYRMKVEDFIKVAELVTKEEMEEDIEDGTEEDNEDDEEPENQLSNMETRTPIEETKKKTGKSKIKVIPKEQPIEA